MTVIAWDGRTLAADTLGGYGSMVRRTRKLRLLDVHGERLAVAGCGTARAIAAMAAWVARGADVDTFPALVPDDVNDTALIVVAFASGRVTQYDGAAHGYPIHSVPCAFGSGGALALGAMAMGADAVRAVEIACRHDMHCGAPIEYVTADSPSVALATLPPSEGARR